MADDGQVLSISWDDGSTDRLPAELLRRASRAASAVRAAVDGAVPRLPDDIRLTDVRMVGAYAVQLSFSDGHERGIYPWIYLRSLAQPAA
ncbi:MAG TPA: DUF971 domain-containing protein [Roseiarcus sp.]